MNFLKNNSISATSTKPSCAPPWCILFILIVIVVAAFYSSVKFGFLNYDDPLYITENPKMNTGLNLENLKWTLFSTGETKLLWGPLTFASHQLDVSLFGLNPAGHHAVNILWHILATAFLFLTAHKLTKSTFWSFFIALIWAIHPEKVQSVAWLSERKDVLSGALFFATLYCYTIWKSQSTKSPLLYVTSLLLFILALLAKPSVVPLPLVLFLLFHLDPKRILASVRQAALPLLPFITTSLLVTGIVIYFQSEGKFVDMSETFSTAQKANNIVVSYAFYLKRFFWPAPAQLWFVPTSSMIPFLVSGLVLGVLGYLVFWLGKKEKLIIVGAAIYTVLWLPISGLVSVSYYFVADRYSYLPQIGLILMLIGLVRLLTRSYSNIVPVALSLGVFSAFLLFIQQNQLPLWKNNETLFGHEMKVNNRSLLAHIHYGEVFCDSDPEKALLYYTKAHQNDPQAGAALTKMGMMQKKLGRTDEALKSFLKAATVTNEVPQNKTQLLMLQVELRLYEDAEKTIQQGLERDPENWAFIMNTGNFYLMVLKQPQTALSFFLKAHTMKPSDLRPIKACANTYRALGNTTEANKYESLLSQKE